MGASDVYLRSKVPEDMYDTLQKFAEIRKLDRIGLVRDFNLFPEPTNLLTLERKYGDSLNHEDMYGVPQKKKRRVIVGDESGTINNDQETKTVISGALTENKSRTVHSMRQSNKQINTEGDEDEEADEQSKQVRDHRFSDC